MCQQMSILLPRNYLCVAVRPAEAYDCWQMLPKKLSPKEADALRVARVRQLFQIRHPGNPKETEILIFFGWLQRHNPDLLPKEEQGDPYQH